MNIFKREAILFLRSRLFQLLFPLGILAFSLWILVGLKIFESNSLDIVSVYNVVPLIFAFIIPLMSYNFWQRERALGLSSILLNRNCENKLIILYKSLSLILIFTILLILYIPVIFILSKAGSIDLGQLFSINLGLICFVCFGVTLTNLLSIVIKSRILNVITGVLILVLIGYGNKKLLTFYSGLLNFSNLVYTICLSILFLVIILSLLNRKMEFKELFVVILVLISSLFIPGSIDLTSLQSHTITKYTKNLINSSNSEFELSYYYSEKLLTSSDMPKQIIHLVNQLNNLKNFKVNVITDKNPSFSEAIRIYQPGSLDDGSIYNFIVIKSKDFFKVIPFIPYVETLEFEISKVLQYFLNNGLKRVGLYIGNEEFTEDNFTALNTALSEHFKTSILFPGDIIPDDLDALFVIGQYGINYTYTSEIGHYLSHGGNLIIGDTGLPTSENLNYRDTPMLEALRSTGIEIEPYIIAEKGNTEDYDLNIVTYPNRELKGNSIVLPFTGFLGIYTSPILIKSGNFVNLLYTSKQTWLVDSTTGLEGVPETDFPVAVYGEGNFSESFTGIKSSEINKLLVIGNSVSFTDYIVGVAGDNSFDFIIRSLYTMVGEEDLMTIRHKYNWEKTLIKFERDIYRDSKLFVLKLLILLYPFLILITTTVFRRKT